MRLDTLTASASDRRTRGGQRRDLVALRGERRQHRTLVLEVGVFRTAAVGRDRHGTVASAEESA